MYTYIIVDDESLIRKGTIKKLSPMSDLVQCIGEADEGQAGIRLIEAQKPDFVILDMQMPGMDGTQLLAYLSEHYPGMPLIVISGFRDFDYIKTAISADAIDYILKPFSREAIQECVQRAIQRLENTHIPPSEELNALLRDRGTAEAASGISLADLLRRPQLSYDDLALLDPDRPTLSRAIRESVEINLKYEGYIRRQLRQVEEFRRMEEKALPPDLDYETVDGKPKTYEMISRRSDLAGLKDLAGSPTDSVVLIMTDESGERILLNREFRMPIGRNMWRECWSPSLPYGSYGVPW